MKQIVIARIVREGAGGDRGPPALAFRVGSDRDIQPPISRQGGHFAEKGESEQVQLPTDVALFVASNVRTNVRELEGALVRLIAWCQLNRMEITLASTSSAQAVH